MSGKKSRDKGHRGERNAVRLLNEIGFSDAQKNSQTIGRNQSEVECPDQLPNLHFEIKFLVKGLHVGTRLWESAIEQMEVDAATRDKIPVLLWKQEGVRQWYLTFKLTSDDGRDFCYVTVPEIDIRHVLTRLNQKAET